MIELQHTCVYKSIHHAYASVRHEIIPVNPVSVALQNADSVQQRIQVLQDQLLQMPEAEIITLHNFLPDIYERVMQAPAGTMIVGAAHKTPYRVRLEKGTITVNIGTDVRTLTAPCEFDAPAGEQRIGYTHSDVIWTDIYENSDNCTNIDTLEDRLYVIPECGLYDARKRNGQRALGETSWLE